MGLQVASSTHYLSHLNVVALVIMAIRVMHSSGLSSTSSRSLPLGQASFVRVFVSVVSFVAIFVVFVSVLVLVIIVFL